MLSTLRQYHKQGRLLVMTKLGLKSTVQVQAKMGSIKKASLGPN